MLSNLKQLTATFAAVALVSLLSATQAAPIAYSDASDIPPGVLTYTDIEEDSATDPIPLFGAPDVSVNTLDFDPSGFVSTTTGGPLDITDGQLNFGFNALPNTGVTSLLFEEGGDYSFTGVGGAGTTVSASLLVSVKILEVDHVTLATPIVVNKSMSFSADMGTEGVGADFWDFGLLVELGAAIAPGYQHGVTLAEVVLNNQLTSNSEEDSAAFIAKKDFTVTPGGDLDPNEIPEPAPLA